jgi:hypothetical protein
MPLDFGRCLECGLGQLLHKLPIEDLYSSDYGYESHLNASMVLHLQNKARKLGLLISGTLKKSDKWKVLDIASNDGTFLREIAKFIKDDSLLIGCDPLISNFVDCYPSNALKIEQFFTRENLRQVCSSGLNLITSMSVFYDVEKPVIFAQDIWDSLDWGGFWHLEQSYLPQMILNNSYDTICHEHLLYFTANDLFNIAEKVGFNIVDCQLNSVNGGSIEVTMQKNRPNENFSSQGLDIKTLIQQEILSGFMDGSAHSAFADSSKDHSKELRDVLKGFRSQGYSVYGLGASTKGNVILSWAGLDASLFDGIGEVNEKKFGKVTPGTNIPIINEKDILEDTGENKVAVVLPWHFRETFVSKAEKFIATGGKLIFPLPKIEIIDSSSLIEQARN